MKRKFLIISWLGFLTGMCLLFFSCTKDLKDDIRDLQKSVLAGIVMLDTDTMEILKGEEFKVRFRVNPSGFQVSKENFALDVLKSDVYIRQKEDEGKAEIRASYINPLYYECLSVEPDKNASGEVLDGQWVAHMKASVDVDMVSFDHVAPVISYRDVNGKQQLITATSACVLNIRPTVEECLHIYCPQAQTLDFLGAEETSTLPYVVLIDHYYYQNKDGKYWSYDYNQFADAKVVFENGEGALFVLVKNRLNRGGVFLEPNMLDTKWADFKNSDREYIDFNFTLQLFGKNEELIIEKPLSMRYYRISSYTAEAKEVSLTEVDNMPDGSYYTISIEDERKMLGIDEDKVGKLARRGVSYQKRNLFQDPDTKVWSFNASLFAGDLGETVESFLSCSIYTTLLGDQDAGELNFYYVMTTKVTVPFLSVE